MTSLTDFSHLTEEGKVKDRKPPRFTVESFKPPGKEQVAKSSAGLNDPFSEIDPLWPLKRS